MSAKPTTRFALIGGSMPAAALLITVLAATIALSACSAGPVSHDGTADLAGGGRGLAGGGGSTGGGGSSTGGGGGGAGGRGDGGGEARGSGDVGGVSLRIETLPLATLTAEEIDGLAWMREEEKLAHDVYVALGDTWGSRVFDNITAAETTHMDAIKTLLDRYGIADPAAGQPAGVFTNPDLQALYADLVTRGKASLVEAFTVGALIEDLDISDLRVRATDTPDIALVYGDLERGSENHLRAFVRNLGRQGAAYSPAYLSADEFESIIGAPAGQGRSG